MRQTGCMPDTFAIDRSRIENTEHIFLRDKCVACGKCTYTCYAGALVLTGKMMTIDEVMNEILKDRTFYEVSKGGVTLSGGDPLIQCGFSQAVLERCKAEGLHTAIETAANCSWGVFEKLLPMIDLVMMDIKHLDPERHREATGVSNRLILRNAQRLSETGKPLIVRTPVVLGVNDTPEVIGEIAQFIKAFPNLQYYELLPFHRLGEGKYPALGLDCPASHRRIPTKGKMRELAEQARGFGIEVRA